jgi:hypothetical protein
MLQKLAKKERAGITHFHHSDSSESEDQEGKSLKSVN